MCSKYTVSLAVDGRIAVDVAAESPQEAYELAKEAFARTADLRLMEARDPPGHDYGR